MKLPLQALLLPFVSFLLLPGPARASFDSGSNGSDLAFNPPAGSYVVDLRLAMAAKSRLAMEGRKLGYGMHIDGDISWDGQSSSFGQFTVADPASMPLHDWGAFDDPYQFYSSVPYVRERLNWSARFKWLLGAHVVNRKVNELRASPGKPGVRPGARASSPAAARTSAPEN